ncbi:SUF system Fe-S cluster assembly regulator [Fastidiosibacter lacustris]|uniref:SUF system Fe-S cluster assembly regulator n=1 Tax=Fastidiosibacter lacustris TaxID=2056695 RepID=UPI000E3492A9|nr:SUF system Fe-S cluster assembly regulator [Fastidiosibacter lacustris]
MLKVSKLADYAVMTVLKIAQSPQALHSATDLVAVTRLNLPTLRKILKILSNKGILHAKRGSEGGYELVKDIKTLSVLDVVEAIDGQLAFTECCEKGFKYCAVTNCQMSSYWHVINKKVRETLNVFSIQELINREINSKEIKHYD